jgi:two-component system, LytTR family, sensor kinase
VNKFLRTALISSPLLAFYAVMPLYVSNLIPNREGFAMMIAITLFTFIDWLINIYTIKVTQRKSQWIRYLMSYCLTFVFHFFMAMLGNYIGPRNIPFENPELMNTNIIFYPLLTVLAFNTIILILCNLIIAEDTKKNIALEVQKLRVENLEAEKQILKQQLQPHFLFNAMSTLKSLIRENPEAAENYSVRLSEFLRYSFQVNDTELVHLHEEIAFTNTYIELQSARFNESFICVVDLPSDCLDKKIPVHSIQPLIENAFKHNSFTLKKPLRIAIAHEDGKVVVSNNKAPKKNVELSGTGLQNLNKRYQLILDKDIEIIDSTDTFVVKLCLV